MTSSDAPRVPRSRARLRAFRSGVLALFVFVVSLALVVTSPTTSRALVATPEPVTIKQALDSPPGRVVKSTAKAATFAKFGKAAQIAMLLYSTSDIWWPKEKGVNEGGSENESRGTGSCRLSTSGALNQRADGTSAPGWLRLDVSMAGSGGPCDIGNNPFAVTYSLVEGGAYSPTNFRNVQPGDFPGRTVTSEHFLGPGRIVGVTVNPNLPLTQASYNVLTISEPVPADVWTEETTTRCSRSDGSEFTVTKTYTGYPGRTMIPSCRAVDPASTPLQTIVKGGPDGGVLRDLWEATVDKGALERDFGDCLGPSGLKCKIRVWVDGNPCTLSDTGPCRYWKRLAEDDTQTQRVQCRFGSYVVPLSDCDDLEKRYRPEVDNPPVREVEPDGTPRTDPDPRPNPQPSTAPNPTSPPIPTTGPNPLGPRVKPNDPTADPDSQSCYGEAWGWNPVDWVMVPVKCALQWAFVPKTSLSTRVATITGTMKTKLPFSLVGGLAGVPTLVPGGSCPNWKINVGNVSENVVCDSSYTDAIRAGRPVFAAMMGTLALWPLIRGVAYASVPILKPSPGTLK